MNRNDSLVASPDETIIIESLEALRAHPSEMIFDAHNWNRLIDILQYRFCTHQWTTIEAKLDSSDGPRELETVCEKCGLQKQS